MIERVAREHVASLLIMLSALKGSPAHSDWVSLLWELNPFQNDDLHYYMPDCRRG
jgi:hypothetical protein